MRFSRGQRVDSKSVCVVVYNKTTKCGKFIWNVLIIVIKLFSKINKQRKYATRRKYFMVVKLFYAY